MARIFDAIRGRRAGESRITPASTVCPESGGDIESLVMVATSAWLLPDVLPADHASAAASIRREREGGHQALLTELLRPDLPGSAWIGWDPAWTAGPVPPSTTRWRSHHDAYRDCRTIATQMSRLATCTRESCDPDRFDADLVGLRHRVYLDERRLRAVTGGPPVGVDTSVVILDFRLFQISGEVRCHLSRSVWSAPPRGHDYRPQGMPPREQPPPRVDDLAAYHTAFAEIDRRITQLVDRYLMPRLMWLFDQSYGMPVFWVAVPRQVAGPQDPSEFLAASWFDRMNCLARLFLDVWDVRDSVVNGGVINGQMLVFRRFRRYGRSSHPIYLIVPARALEPDVLIRERLVGSVITTLTDLEAIGATELQWVLDDLETWRNHIQMFAAVAEHAAILWDAVASHLPVRRLRQLGRVHRAVELIHQILLHGVADLGNLRSFTVQCRARVEAVAKGVGERFDDVLTERGLCDFAGLRRGLTGTGMFDEVTTHGEEVADEAARVGENYQQLISSIGSAFDERRVRESDKLQYGGALLSIPMAFIGLISILDAVVQLKPPDGDSHSTIFGTGSRLARAAAEIGLGLGSLPIVTAVLAIVLVVRLGRLGGRRFRRRYSGTALGRRRIGVWRYLRAASSDTLERQLRHIARTGRADGRDLRQWDAIDRELAGHFAEIWDDVSAPAPARVPAATGVAGRGPSPAIGSARKDITRLSRDIEQWAVQALLLTERAWRMHRYVLPRLACLYRYCGDVDWTFVSTSNGAGGTGRISALSDTDFGRNMHRLGFNWDEAQRIRAWLSAQTGGMRDLLQRLEALGIGAGMDDARRRRLLRDIGAGAGRDLGRFDIASDVKAAKVHPEPSGRPW